MIENNKDIIIKQIIYSEEEPNINDIKSMLSATNTDRFNLAYSAKINKWELVLWKIR